MIDLKKRKCIYPAIYSDQNGKIKAEIENKFNEETSFSLFLNLDGIMFQGSSFDDFELINPKNYSKKQLNRFTLNKVKVWQSEKYVLELCNCELSFDIPLLLINIQNNTTIITNLLIDLKLGKPATNGGIESENAVFKIAIEGIIYTSEGDVFEDPLIELQNQFVGKYHFKSCFGCLYSDYSSYGNGFFGDLICLRNCKSEYLNANSKIEWLELMEKNSIPVQETYYCQEFEKRVKNTGYRG